MDRGVLEGWLAEGCSLEEMGRRAQRHPSTVGYWLGKHGLEAVGRAVHASRGGIDAATLRSLIDEGLSGREIAARLDLSLGTVRHWLGRHGLKTTRTGRTEGVTPRGAAAGTRFPGRCSTHGDTEFIIRTDGSPRCLICRSAAVGQRRRRVKAILVEDAGGACVLCGYDRHPGALHFHHKRPEEKLFSIAGTGVTRSLDRARAEASKCVLLCGNCHAEVESGVAVLPSTILDAHPVDSG